MNQYYCCHRIGILLYHLLLEFCIAALNWTCERLLSLLWPFCFTGAQTTSVLTDYDASTTEETSQSTFS